jgi:hypothetical protein
MMSKLFLIALIVQLVIAPPDSITINRSLPIEGSQTLLETEEGDLITLMHTPGTARPAIGLARKPDNLTIIQDGVLYTITSIRYREDRVIPDGTIHPGRRP